MVPLYRFFIAWKPLVGSLQGDSGTRLGSWCESATFECLDKSTLLAGVLDVASTAFGMVRALHPEPWTLNPEPCTLDPGP